MKYKLIGDNFIFSPIKTVLKNRGITEELFQVSSKDIIKPLMLNNIDEGIKILMKNIGKKILIVVDSDCDGMTSAAVIYRYLKEEFKDIKLEYRIHTEKQHGLSSDIKVEDDISLVILPDASSNDFKQHKELKERGIDVLVLDHHECDLGYSKHAVVINNQLSESYPNKKLSGVGIVYKFLKELDGYLFIDKADKYLDLVALGNVADMMDLNSRETRYFVYEGIKNINNPFIQALMEDNKYDLEGKYNIEKIGWTIAPKINGVIRSGSYTEKENMFEAFISDNYGFCLDIAKMCKKIKAAQDRNVKKSLVELEKEINLEEGDKCIILDTNNKLNSTFRGLVAQKISDKYGVPTLLYSNIKDKEGYIGGSFRGSNLSGHFRTDLLGCDVITMAQGHENAGGFELKIENLDKLKEYLNTFYKDREVFLGKEYNVDFELEAYEIEDWIVDELAQYEDEFGNGVDSPLILIKKLKIHKDELNINKNNIIFDYNYIKFIKKFATKVLKEELSSHEELELNIIGKCSINTYNNKGQIEIVEIEIKN